MAKQNINQKGTDLDAALQEGFFQKNLKKIEIFENKMKRNDHVLLSHNDLHGLYIDYWRDEMEITQHKK